MKKKYMNTFFDVTKDMEYSVSSDRTKKEKRVHPFPKGIVPSFW